jgi:hypothetical protein
LHGNAFPEDFYRVQRQKFFHGIVTPARFSRALLHVMPSLKELHSIVLQFNRVFERPGWWILFNRVAVKFLWQGEQPYRKMQPLSSLKEGCKQDGTSVDVLDSSPVCKKSTNDFDDHEQNGYQDSCP